ncbi:MAG: hypothetical protein WBW33_15410 [Bryobacteraceae bacterium]
MKGSQQDKNIETHRLIELSNQNGLDFLDIDLDVATTFMDIAEGSMSEETIHRNHKNARKVYETVARLLPRLRPDRLQRQAIDEKLNLLRTRLQAKGQQF